jgi:hypothetical protein
MLSEQRFYGNRKAVSLSTTFKIQPLQSILWDVTVTTSGTSLIMPDARILTPGLVSTIFLTGANSTNIKDVSGGTILTFFLPGFLSFVLLLDNSTAAGQWYAPIRSYDKISE